MASASKRMRLVPVPMPPVVSRLTCPDGRQAAGGARGENAAGAGTQLDVAGADDERGASGAIEHDGTAAGGRLNNRRFAPGVVAGVAPANVMLPVWDGSPMVMVPAAR